MSPICFFHLNNYPSYISLVFFPFSDHINQSANLCVSGLSDVIEWLHLVVMGPVLFVTTLAPFSEWTGPDFEKGARDGVQYLPTWLQLTMTKGGIKEFITITCPKLCWYIHQQSNQTKFYTYLLLELTGASVGLLYYFHKILLCHPSIA